MKHESKKLLRVFLENNKINNFDLKMTIKEHRLIKKHEGNNFNYDCAFIAEALHNNYVNNKEVSFFLIKFLKVVTIENLKKIALLTYNTPEKALKIISELGFIL